MSTDPSVLIQPAPSSGKAAHAGETVTPARRHSRCVRGGGDDLGVNPDMLTVTVDAHSFDRTFPVRAALGQGLSIRRKSLIMRRKVVPVCRLDQNRIVSLLFITAVVEADSF